jgi:sugar phosphate isomerase/epimerase
VINISYFYRSKFTYIIGIKLLTQNPFYKGVIRKTLLVIRLSQLKKYRHVQPFGYSKNIGKTKIGFLVWTGYSSLEKMFKSGSNLGYDAVEINASPQAMFNPDKVLKNGKNEILGLTQKYKLSICALVYHANMLHLDKRKEIYDHFKKVILCAEALEVPTIGAHPGYELPGVDEDKCWSEYQSSFGEIVDFAGEHNVKIGVEPLRHYEITSLVYNVPTIERLLETFPSKSLGLTYDPSHLASRMIDYMVVLRKFSDRIYNVHAKDAEILYDVLKDYGVFAPEQVLWWRFRIPGWGIINWKEVITALYELNYNYGFSAEIEDPIFQGEEGCAKAIEYLKPLWCSIMGK